MTEEKKLELLSEVFDCEVEDLSASKNLEELDIMDSMTLLSLIAMMDDEFGKTLTRQQIKSLKTVDDILALME